MIKPEEIRITDFTKLAEFILDCEIIYMDDRRSILRPKRNTIKRKTTYERKS